MSINFIFKPVLKYLFFFQCLVASAQVSGNIPSYYVFVENGMQGVKNDEDEIIIPADYEQMGWSDSGFEVHTGVMGYKKNGAWGLISTSNKLITNPVYQELSIKGSGVYIIASKKQPGIVSPTKGIIDSSGETIIDFRYSGLKVINESILAHRPSGNNLDRVGLLNMEGEILIPFEYLSLRSLGSLRFAAEMTSGKFILFSDTGQRIGDILLDSLSGFDGNYAKIWKNQWTGLIDRSGKIVINPEYKDISITTRGIEGRKFDDWVEIGRDNKIYAHFEYDKVDRLNEEVFLVSANGRHWLINESNERIGSVTMDSVQEFSEDLAVAKHRSRWGVIQSNGEWLLPPVYKSIQRRNGFFNTRDQRNRWRVFDKFAIEKTKGFYDEIGDYQKLHFPVRKGDYWGLISRTGDLAVNCVFDSLGDISYGMLTVKFKGLYGIIDLEGHWLVLPSSHKKVVVNEDLYLEAHKEQSILKKYDNDIVYFTDNPIQLFEDYFIERLSTGKVWKINYSGVIQTKELENVVHREPVKYSEFEDIFVPSEGFVGIKKDGKYGFVDDQNRLRIANRYDSIKSFHEGFAAIKLLGRWGFIDKSENLRIQPVYDWVDLFEGGICVVRQENKYFLLTQEGKLLFTSGFDDLKPSTEQRYLVRKEQQYGLVAKDGTMLVNYIYDQLIDLGNGAVIVRKLNKYGVLNTSGVNIIPRLYDDLVFDPELGRFFGKKEAIAETINPLD